MRPAYAVHRCDRHTARYAGHSPESHPAPHAGMTAGVTGCRNRRTTEIQGTAFSVTDHLDDMWTAVVLGPHDPGTQRRHRRIGMLRQQSGNLVDAARQAPVARRPGSSRPDHHPASLAGQPLRPHAPFPTGAALKSAPPRHRSLRRCSMMRSSSVAITHLQRPARPRLSPDVLQHRTAGQISEQLAGKA